MNRLQKGNFSRSIIILLKICRFSFQIHHSRKPTNQNKVFIPFAIQSQHQQVWAHCRRKLCHCLCIRTHGSVNLYVTILRTIPQRKNELFALRKNGTPTPLVTDLSEHSLTLALLTNKLAKRERKSARVCDFAFTFTLPASRTTLSRARAQARNCIIQEVQCPLWEA